MEKIPLEFAEFDASLGFLKIGNNHDCLENIGDSEDLTKMSEGYNLYLEWIESELMLEVNDKTDKFQDEMTSLENLIEESDQMVKNIKSFHSILDPLIERLNRDQVELVELEKELEKIDDGIDVLKMIPSWISSKNVIQTMLDAHEFKDALLVINNRLDKYEKGRNYFPEVKFMKKSYDELEEMKIALEKMDYKL